ncbi:MAG: SDR family NAD(P)-dependent oxidoreductase [Bacteroidota bacterium]|nr:SDR family NAD(P)-dependent oxidoreductase [Bacteroidota bacterium]
MELREKYGRNALVAGASEGIGAAFADYLGSSGMDLILVARRLEPLKNLAGSLKNKYNVGVTCIPCDLSESNSIELLKAELNGMEVDVLVYNAALSFIGPFIKNKVEDHLRQLRLNIITPLEMLHVFGEKMLASGQGAVILMTSLSGFQGSGNLSVYAATKAFARIIGESLWYEWKNKGVDVIACCAGATATPGYINSRPETMGWLNPRVQTPEEVVCECFKYLGKQPSFISGRGNRIASFFMQKVLTRKMAVSIMGDTTRKIYRIRD